MDPLDSRRAAVGGGIAARAAGGRAGGAARRGLAAILVLALAGAAAAAAERPRWFPAPPSPDPEVRDRQARRVEEIFQKLAAAEGEARSERHRISQAELNSYLAILVTRERLDAVETLHVVLRPGEFSTYAVVDVGRIPRESRDAAMRLLVETVLSGRQYLSADGTLEARNGMGRYTMTAARMNDLNIPPPLVNALINSVGRWQGRPFDLAAPFRLPHNIQAAEIGDGYLEVY